MPTPNKPLRFLLQTLAIIAIISLSIPATTFAITSNSGTSQAKSGAKGGGSGMNGTQSRDYSQSSYRTGNPANSPANGGNPTSQTPNSVSSGGVNRNNQSGASRSGAGYGTSKPVSSGSSGSSIQTGGSRASGGASDRNSVPGYSGGSRSGGDTGGQGGGGSQEGQASNERGGGGGQQSAPGNAVSNLARIASGAMGMGIATMKAVATAAKKAAGINADQAKFAGLPELNTPIATPNRDASVPNSLREKYEQPKAVIPNNIRTEINKQRAEDKYANDISYLPMTDAQREKLKEQFKEELGSRARGEYKGADMAVYKLQPRQGTSKYTPSAPVAAKRDSENDAAYRKDAVIYVPPKNIIVPDNVTELQLRGDRTWMTDEEKKAEDKKIGSALSDKKLNENALPLRLTSPLHPINADRLVQIEKDAVQNKINTKISKQTTEDEIEIDNLRYQEQFVQNRIEEFKKAKGTERDEWAEELKEIQTGLEKADKLEKDIEARTRKYEEKTILNLKNEKPSNKVQDYRTNEFVGQKAISKIKEALSKYKSPMEVMKEKLRASIEKAKSKFTIEDLTPVPESGSAE